MKPVLFYGVVASRWHSSRGVYAIARETTCYYFGVACPNGARETRVEKADIVARFPTEALAVEAVAAVDLVTAAHRETIVTAQAVERAAVKARDEAVAAAWATLQRQATEGTGVFVPASLPAPTPACDTPA